MAKATIGTAVYGTAEEAAEEIVATIRNRRFLGTEAPRNDKNKGLTTAHPSASSPETKRATRLVSDVTDIPKDRRRLRAGSEGAPLQNVILGGLSAASDGVPLQSLRTSGIIQARAPYKTLTAHALRPATCPRQSLGPVFRLLSTAATPRDSPTPGPRHWPERARCTGRAQRSAA